MIKNYIGSGIALSVVFFEIFMSWKSNSCLNNYSLIALGLVIFAFFIFNRKDHRNFLLAFLVPFHHHAGSIAGVFLIIFVVIQAHLIGSSFYEFLNGHEEGIKALIYLGLLLLPFMIQSWFIPKKRGKINKEERELLITFLSPQNLKSSPDDLTVEFDKCYNDGNYNRPVFNKKEQSRNVLSNWEPIFKTLDMYESVSKVVLILTKKVFEQLDNYQKEKGHSELLIKQVLENLYQDRNLMIKIEIIDNIDTFDDSYNHVKGIVESYCKKYPHNKGKEVLFNITSGTAVATMCLSFLAIKGDRGVVYTRQDESGKLEDINVDIYALNELWDEILGTFK